MTDALCVKSFNVGILMHSSRHTVLKLSRSVSDGRETPTIREPVPAAMVTNRNVGFFIGVYSPRSAVFCDGNRGTSCRMWLFATHGRSSLRRG